MMWILYVSIFLVVTVIVFFRIPYSKTKSRFLKDVQKCDNKAITKSEVFSEQDILSLPKPVQKYFRVSGYIGKPKMTSMTAYMPSVPMKDPEVIVDFTLLLFADEPTRLAYIKSSMYGMPFEAYDVVQNGVGYMKGVIGKIITLFNETGNEMNKSQLLTYLGESFFLPSAIIGKHITWEAIDDTSAKATITYNDISGSGIFTFGDDGFVKSFYTHERGKMKTDGSKEYIKWSAIYEEFVEEDGVYYPGGAKAIWHENNGDLIYFDANNIKITYKY